MYTREKSWLSKLGSPKPEYRFDITHHGIRYQHYRQQILTNVHLNVENGN
ncbi:unnamed protein product [Acanthoscelides obtectus]|uniref:Uncharacterized protein n=1 Tax=Acanthoscelides obtectus TaxID=200917 RepID=A0A9P0LQZ0_ACAOB|nr:unnamed protein product [Acanthoscelides obtectus]CAK1649693.1 hypothetical protein AOBTE_LOCUS16359 [Acanthoscelides obtectus]